MATGKALNGKPYAGNPHVRFDEGEVASATAMPRRGSLLYEVPISRLAIRVALVAAAVAVHSAFADTPDELFDYVQTDGTAYIDTGIIGKTGTKASIGMMWHNGGGTKDVCFLGARNGSTGRFLLCHAYGGNWSLAYRSYYTSSAVVTNPKPADDTFYSVQSEIDATGVYKITVNGKSYTHNPNSGDTGNWSSSFSMYLFALQGQTSGTANNKSPSGTRCYWTRIWQQDANGVYQFVRDFVPCKKGDRVGLWDRVSGDIFYPAAGTLTAGSTVAVHAEPDKMLEYVESDGTQYIDTGVVGRDGTKAEIDFKFNELGSSSIIFLGADDSDPWGSNNKFYLLAYRSYDGTITDGYAKRYNQTFAATTDRCKVISEVVVGGTFKTTMNGSTVTHDYTADPGPYNSGLSLYLFTNNRNGTKGTLSAKARCYGLKIEQTDSNGDYLLVRDFRPCIKDGRAGLYDKVSNMVYFSRGTKDFSAEGARVLSARGAYDKLLEYVESDGTQYIDTGVDARSGTKATAKLVYTESNTSLQDNYGGYVVLGAKGSSNTSYLYMIRRHYNGDNWRWMTCYGGRYQTLFEDMAKDQTYVLASEITTNGTCKATRNGGNVSERDYSGQTSNGTVVGALDTGVNFYALAANLNGNPGHYAKARLYSMKIWQTDANGDYQLVRDFIPCIKDGSAGFYDSVSGTVYFSLGANEFSAEGARVLSARGAPDKFLKYVTSTGEQYIDTGVVGRDGTKAEIDFKFNELGSSSIILLGADNSDPWGSNNKFYLLAYRSVNATITDGYKNRYNQTFDATTDRCQVISEVVAGGTFKTTLNGKSTKTHDYTADPGPYNSGLSLYLFTNNRNGTAGALSAKARCYGLKIEQTDANGVYQTVRDYKPCMKDGRVGLYDEVSDTVYFSLSKTDLVAPPKGVMIIVE